MKQVFIFSALALVSFVAQAQKKKLAIPKKPGCMAELSPFLVKGIDTTPSRGVALNEYMWDNGKVISVRFMPGGSQTVRDRVKQYSKEWEQFANIKFNYLPDNTPSTSIRIQLGDRTHDSYPGKYCNEIPQDEQTLNLDTTDFIDWDYYITQLENRIARRDTVINTWEPDRFVRNILGKRDLVWRTKVMRGTTLHEFGHALGLMHEQSFPGAIRWKKTDSVYNHYLKNNPNWTRETVDYNVFEVSDIFYTNGTSYDSKSIMHYAVEPWQTTNGYSVARNYDLSDGDKRLIAALYPKNKVISDLLLPEVTIKNITGVEVQQNYKGKKGISIFPKFDLSSNPKLSPEVHFVARVVFDDQGKSYYVTNKTEQYHWGGYLAGVLKKMVLPNTKTSYNKLKKDMEIFIPQTQIPAWLKDYKVRFEFFVAVPDPKTKQLVKIVNYLSPTTINLAQ